MNIKETKKNIILAGHIAVEDSDEDISADRLKNAAATKKLAIFDAFEILKRIEEEDNIIENKVPVDTEKDVSFGGFAERRSK